MHPSQYHDDFRSYFPGGTAHVAAPAVTVPAHLPAPRDTEQRLREKLERQRHRHAAELDELRAQMDMLSREVRQRNALPLPASVPAQLPPIIYNFPPASPSPPPPPPPAPPPPPQLVPDSSVHVPRVVLWAVLVALVLVLAVVFLVYFARLVQSVARMEVRRHAPETSAF